MDKNNLSIEQQNHLQMLNEKIKVVKKELIENVRKVGRDFLKLYEDGNVMYENARINGKILIDMTGEDVPREMEYRIMGNLIYRIIDIRIDEIEELDKHILPDDPYEVLVINKLSDKFIAYDEIMFFTENDVMSDVQIVI